MRLLRDVVDGLAHAHRHGIVHRDINPDNVMIADRHALLVDLGVAKALSDANAHHDLTSISPRIQLMRESMAWRDKYIGPVR